MLSWSRSMGPAACYDYDRKRLRPVEEGELYLTCLRLAFRAIANATGLAKLRRPLHARDHTGNVRMRTSDIEIAYGEQVTAARRQARYHGAREKPCVTKDG